MRLKPILILVLFLGVARAGTISMTVSTENVIFPENMSISIENQGDEAAFNVRLSVISDNFVADDAFVKKLEPRQKLNLSLGINSTGDNLPGLYPAVIMTRYEDANGYPFSSVSPNYIVYEEMSSSDIYATIRSTS